LAKARMPVLRRHCYGRLGQRRPTKPGIRFVRCPLLPESGQAALRRVATLNP